MTAIPLPGAEPFSPALAARLAAALAARGPAYVPRTHHREGNVPRYSNRLLLETSPYLLQHAHNPVNWYPWGDEAFEDARRLNRPVFLSVGYSTCHWCHVMEEESFEDEEIAAAMNAGYVCIKVDREERPDVDAVYMAAVQALTGQGGWPMNVWLTPDRRPFFGGTYYPPRDGDRGARSGFLTLLGHIRRTWDAEADRVRQATDALTEAVKTQMEGAAPAGSVPGPAIIAQAIEGWKGIFDRTHGGLRRAPKFPSSLPVRLLLRHHLRTGDPEALAMATLTLEKMAAGGMYDQLGGGFHRYSTDDRWLVPHFEKMLYDNALLAVAYAEAHQATGRADFARVVREVLDYVLRELTAPEGGFYSATDADSVGPDGRSEEGQFFVWSADEIRRALGGEAEAFMRHYGVTDAGNWEGTNVLAVPRPDEAAWAALVGARATLYDLRARRPPPLRDEKILAAWNGLMISALAVGGFVLDEPRYVAAAARAADFLLGRMRRGDRLGRSYKDGRVSAQGFLEDQVFVTAGLLDLFRATFDPRWLREALALADAVEAHFADAERGGWFMTARDAEALIARERPLYDGAEPSGTSVALSNALRLEALTGDDRWRVVAERGFAAVGEVLAHRPFALAEALLALDLHHGPRREVALVWPDGQDGAAARPFLDVLRRRLLPGVALVGAAAGPDAAALAALTPLLRDRPAPDGRAGAYVCERGRCELPATDPAELERQLVG